jgi:hypothetical protein
MIDPMSVVHGAKEIAELVKKYNDIPALSKDRGITGTGCRTGHGTP